MPEYIEREAAIEFVKNYTPILTNDGTSMKCVERSIRNAPAADVVEVVRCKNCKKWTWQTILDGHACAHWSSTEDWKYTGPNDFCRYGERRDY